MAPQLYLITPADPDPAQFPRLLMAVLTRFPRMGDAALQRLVIYRHICRFVSMLEKRHAASPAEPVPAALETAGASNPA